MKMTARWATKLPPLQGWVLDTFNFCYQNAAPMGLWNYWIISTKLPPLRGWVLDTMNFCYQNIAPMGLWNYWIISLPNCRPYRAGCLIH
jgi:hypothetical protein